MINTKGEYCIPLGKYDWIDPKIHEGRRAVKKGSLWGFVDKTGTEVIVPVFEEVRDFSDGLSAVKRQELWGYIDKNGKMAIPNYYDYATSFATGSALVSRGGHLGNIWWPQNKGTLKETIDSISNSISATLWFMIDKHGNEKIIDNNGGQINALYFINGVIYVDLPEYSSCAYFDYHGNLLLLIDMSLYTYLNNTQTRLRANSLSG